MEKQRAQIDAGGYPFSLKLVGLGLGGLPITDYAPDFWLIQTEDGVRCGYVTSPWWSPELETNIALGYVPWNRSNIGTKLRVELPAAYCEDPDRPVPAEVVEVPFRPSVHPSAREQARGKGRDSGA